MSSNRVPSAAALNAKQRVKVQSDEKNELRMVSRGLQSVFKPPHAWLFKAVCGIGGICKGDINGDKRDKEGGKGDIYGEGVIGGIYGEGGIRGIYGEGDICCEGGICDKGDKGGKVGKCQ
eukprot:304638_1